MSCAPKFFSLQIVCKRQPKQNRKALRLTTCPAKAEPWGQTDSDAVLICLLAGRGVRSPPTTTTTCLPEFKAGQPGGGKRRLPVGVCVYRVTTRLEFAIQLSRPRLQCMALFRRICSHPAGICLGDGARPGSVRRCASPVRRCCDLALMGFGLLYGALSSRSRPCQAQGGAELAAQHQQGPSQN